MNNGGAGQKHYGTHGLEASEISWIFVLPMALGYVASCYSIGSSAKKTVLLGGRLAYTCAEQLIYRHKDHAQYTRVQGIEAGNKAQDFPVGNPYED